MTRSIAEQREAAKKAEEDHKLKLKRFKEKTSGVLDEFLKDIKNPNFKFKPVPKVYRAIMWVSFCDVEFLVRAAIRIMAESWLLLWIDSI